MTKYNLFSKVPATNGLARGYGPQPHKRKRREMRFALAVLLLALSALVLFQTGANSSEQVGTWTPLNKSAEMPDGETVEKQAKKVEMEALLLCLHLSKVINESLIDIYQTPPDVSERTLRLIEAFKGYCATNFR